LLGTLHIVYVWSVLWCVRCRISYWQQKSSTGFNIACFSRWRWWSL